MNCGTCIFYRAGVFNDWCALQCRFLYFPDVCSEYTLVDKIVNYQEDAE